MCGPIRRCGPWVLLVMAMAPGVAVAQEQTPLDIDDWHEAVYGAVPQPPEDTGLSIGLYPGLSAVLGSPNVFIAWTKAARVNPVAPVWDWPL